MNTTTENEYILELCQELMLEHIENNAHLYSKPEFESWIIENTLDILYDIIGFETPFDDDQLLHHVHIAFELCTQILPPRSYQDSPILSTPEISLISTKLNYLQNLPQPAQRTTEWYKYRQEHLTASSIWKAYGSQASKNQLICSKCKPLDIEKYNIVNFNSAMHWGNKYEDVSIQLYELKYNTKVSEFGCIPHKHLHFLAASPDGINTDVKSDRYGRMIEVKNIVNRDITGIPKLEYWIQMQIQMEVCDLDECDFLETRFIEYEGLEDFENDGDYMFSKDGKEKGMMMLFMENDIPHYKYSPRGLDKPSMNLWKHKTIKDNSQFQWQLNYYWKLDQLSLVLVPRNKLWFNYTKLSIIDIWKIIQHEKLHGYTHRLPKSRTNNIIKVIKKNNNDICMINMESIC